MKIDVHQGSPYLASLQIERWKCLQNVFVPVSLIDLIWANLVIFPYIAIMNFLLKKLINTSGYTQKMKHNMCANFI